ncbi:MAG: hypothetical protein IMZ44_05490 [Planctomycetes bacterium]|nr:hypothetical protein [Planctomycetota bacterium]
MTKSVLCAPKSLPEESLVVIHPSECLRRSDIFWSAALLFDGIVTFVLIPEKSRFDAWRSGRGDPELVRNMKAYWERFEPILTLMESGVIRVKTKGIRVDHVMLDFYQFLTHAQPWSRLFTKLLPARMPEEWPEVLEYIGGHLGMEDGRLDVEVGVGASMDFYSLATGIPMLRSADTLSSPAHVLTRLFEQHLPVLRNVNSEQILEARELLRDSLHPLRLTLERVRQTAIRTGNAAEQNAVIAEQLLPLVEDYKKHFKSKLTSLLTAAQGSAKSVYVGLASLVGVTLVSGSPVLAGLAGIIPPFLEIGVKYAADRKQLSDWEKTHPFGFLSKIE